MAKKGRPFAYQSDEEKPVTVSLRLPRDVYEQAKRYVRMHPGMTLTELLLDGLQLRLDTPVDPRDIILSDDNTVMQEVQEMIRAAVQAEIGKLSGFMGSHFSPSGLALISEALEGHMSRPHFPQAAVQEEPRAELSHGYNTVLQEIEDATPPDAPEISSDDNTVIQENASRRPGRRSTLRQPIIDLLREHPEGLTAVELKVHLEINKTIGDTLAGMVRDGLLEKEGSGNTVRYAVRETL